MIKLDNNEIDNKFDNFWTVWYHSNSVRDWSPKSYNKIHVIYKLSDFWGFFNNLPPLDNGMFFVMRKDILPLWEADENKNGGAWAIHVSPKQITNYFTVLTAEMLTNQLCKPTQPLPCETICGISISPKFQGYSIKIWNDNICNADKTIFNSKQIVNDSLNYMKHPI